MKAVAVRPGQAHSIHLREVPEPALDDVPDGRGVLVEVLRVGACGTDEEINLGLYGEAPSGDDYLVIGHENVGRVIDVGPNVPPEFSAGALVVATVRRPGQSIYDQIGYQDITTDDTYYERGINLRHGYLAERYVEDHTYLVALPDSLKEVGVLLEPMSVSQKALRHAYDIQRRLKIWRPQRGAVLGAGPIGLLAALAMRLRGLQVTMLSRGRPPFLKSELTEAIGATYLSTQDISIGEAAEERGPFDLILEATGYSPLAFEAAEALATNGVLLLTSVTGGDRKAEVNADKINQGFVLRNKVMVGSVNAAREDFLSGVDDFIKAEAIYAGWLERLLTTPVQGLDNYEQVIRELTNRDAIKVFVEVARG